MTRGARFRATTAEGLEARGDAAFKAGRERSQCPYGEGSAYREAWLRGYDAAKADAQ